MLMAQIPAAKATEVVNALQAKIKHEPEQFHVLIRVLRSNPALCYLADKLEGIESQQNEPG